MPALLPTRQPLAKQHASQPPLMALAGGPVGHHATSCHHRLPFLTACCAAAATAALPLTAPPQAPTRVAGNILPLGGVSAELGWRTDFAARYQLQQRLGAGEFGVVHAATDATTSGLVAVKVMPKNRPGHPRLESLSRIRREALTHTYCTAGSSYVAKLLGTFEDDSSVYFVQELCQGGDLAAVIQDSPLPEPACAMLISGVLRALAECHGQGVAHNDVKPANFLLKEPSPWAMARAEAAVAAASGAPLPPLASLPDAQQLAGLSEVRAIDFGCSHQCNDPHTPRRAGTPVYMAPECHMAACAFGLGIDVWAAGVMLYQMLTGRYPFWDCKRDAVDKSMPAYQIMLATCQSPIRLSGADWPNISKDARDLVGQMLDRNPMTRITAAEALRHSWFRRHPGGRPFTPPPPKRRMPSASSVHSHDADDADADSCPLPR